jgi:hypothetical protein
MTYDMRHGSPYDRGSADAWYGRPAEPHYYKGPSYQSERVAEPDMTQGEIKAYHAGYGEAEAEADKSW